MEEQHQNASSKRNSLTLKLVAIVVLLVLFLIPAGMVSGLIHERENRQDNTVAEVSSAWGEAQSIVGPVLVVPYTQINAKTFVRTQEYLYFLPEDLDVKGDVETELRSRGIYDVPVYTSKLNFTGSFSGLSATKMGIALQNVDWDRSFLALGIPDMRGVQEQVHLNWDNKKTQFIPGTSTPLLNSGINAPVNLQTVESEFGTDANAKKSYSFNFDVNLRGSKSLSFIPVGKTTNVDVTADWADPSFAGAFLPREHEITKDGFTANWQVLDLNRNLPERFTSTQKVHLPFEELEIATNNYNKSYPRYNPDGTQMQSIETGNFGVRFFNAVDVYSQSSRSAKYAAAVITLIFVLMFFIELTAKRKIHPVQYALIGFALVVYYTLLLSLAEHIRFGFAYTLASAATVGLITLFAKSIMHSWNRALTAGSILSVFYLFVYVLLQLEDFALLLGSIALFVILGVIMFFSRKIDWYGMTKS